MEQNIYIYIYKPPTQRKKGELSNRTTIWSHHLNMEKNLDGNKNAGLCVEKILEAVSNKTVARRVLRNTTAGKVRTNSLKRRSPMTPKHGHTNVGCPAETYIHQLCADTKCRQDDLPRVMADRDK